MIEPGRCGTGFVGADVGSGLFFGFVGLRGWMVRNECAGEPSNMNLAETIEVKVLRACSSQPQNDKFWK